MSIYFKKQRWLADHTPDFTKQRWVFKMAQKAGWSGKEPTILGTFEAEKAYRAAKEFLTSQVNYSMANMWFSGTCAECGVWSNKWQEHTTTEMKCPQCGAEQEVSSLEMHRQRKIG